MKTLLCICCVLSGELLAQTKTQTVQTPFGPTVRQTGAAPRRAPDLSLIQVEEKGDTFTFRRKTPFGDSVWNRQRSELTAFEREIVAAQASQKSKK